MTDDTFELQEMQAVQVMLGHQVKQGLKVLQEKQDEQALQAQLAPQENQALGVKVAPQAPQVVEESVAVLVVLDREGNQVNQDLVDHLDLGDLVDHQAHLVPVENLDLGVKQALGVRPVHKVSQVQLVSLADLEREEVLDQLVRLGKMEVQGNQVLQAQVENEDLEVKLGPQEAVDHLDNQVDLFSLVFISLGGKWPHIM